MVVEHQPAELGGDMEALGEVEIVLAGRRISWSRIRSAIPSFRTAVSPNPLPEPDMRLSPHPALHQTLFSRQVKLCAA